MPAMNPLILYLTLVAVAAVVGLLALAVHRGPRRSCPGCGEEVSMAARACTRCWYVL
jgi:hypothetical protein